MIDTHTHLNFKAFDDDFFEVIERANNQDVEKMIVVGTDVDSSKKAIALAKNNDGLYASIGIHPHHSKQFTKTNSQFSMSDQFKEIEKLIQNDKVVAVGEIGLDFHIYKNSEKYEDVSISKELVEIQKKLFRYQVRLAIEFNKPLIIHSREAKDEVLSQLEAISSRLKAKPKGVFHCFEGSKKYAQKILEAGFYISFAGNITYEKGRGEVSKVVPLDKLLLETDSPYMLPKPIRNKKEKIWRNEPANVKITAQYHAKLRGVDFEEVATQTTLNAQNLFGI